MDFAWIRYIGVNRLGFNHSELGYQTLGQWMDLFECFKQNYNFETKKGLYSIPEAEPISSLDFL